MAKYSDAHICQCLSRLLTSRRNLPVTIANDRHKTGEQFVHEVVALAYGLQELGIKAGDVVAISAYNSDLYLEWLLAIAFVGGIASLLNYRWSIKETTLAINSVRPVMLVTDESCYTWFINLQKEDTSSLRWHVFIGSPSSDFVKKWNVLIPELLKKHLTKLPPFCYSWAPEGAVVICFTSGTTGKPKGVTLSHAALFIQSLAKIAIVGYSEDDIYLHSAPLCHIGGLSSAMAMLMVGGCHVLMPKFDAQSAVDAIEQYTVTSLITVPAIMADMVSLIRGKEIWKCGESIKKILNGGGSLSNELIMYSSIFFPKAKLISAYGMTEACSSLTFLTLYDATQEKIGQSSQMAVNRRSETIKYSQGVCVGKAAPHVELSICADSSGHVGRILTRGPHVMIRYWDQTSTSSLDPSNEVWLDTGDIGSIDQNGNLWLLGRTKGRIKSGGENIYPEEVEAILLEHSGIAAVVIVGIPNARLSEMVVACIQPRKDWQWSEQSVSDDHHLSPENLRQYCIEKNLSRFKIPKMFILWRKPFPLTTTGKIRRDQLRKELMYQLHSLHSNI
ncbi:2-succinylbenzoate--CoA ligase, chloroplastic/peroxisomal [Neltuma alba]|uniref:2-succinylbenzoate--CoA ligase, chloroplastic/peroxisomal n=1 Tax=Neltuma alba TaxID=207710 RepID=UPI0010A4FA38|nr:2-succinylbenzoate--CoA ligase, chloroplastic/peroxisomal-like [Prosopis alba]